MANRVEGVDGAGAPAFRESVRYAEQNRYSRSMQLEPVKGGLIVEGEINLGGTIEPIHSAVNIAELAV